MKSFLSIEINEQKVRYLIVEQGIKGLAFKGAGESALQVGPSAPGALSFFIKDLIASKQLKINRLFLVVSRRDSIVHQLNLGQVSRGDLEMIIPSEIEKIPSFFDQDFEYVYQQQDVKTRQKIVFGAITDELIQYLLKEIRQTGIPCQELEISPLNLAGLLRSQEFKGGPQSFIILNDHITQLLVIEDGQINYIYSTNLGEEILGDNQAIMNWADELKRALKSYCLDTKQSINTNWIIWDHKKSVDFDLYLRKNLNLDVQSPRIMQSYFNEDINPIYALAAVPLIYYANRIKSSFSLNHFLRSSQNFVLMGRLAIIAAIFFIITGIAFGAAINRFNNLKSQAQTNTKNVQDKIIKDQKQSADILEEHNSYLALRQQLLLQATYVQLLKKMSWSQALSVVASEMPVELSLTSFKVDEAGQVTFTGDAFRMESISKLLRTIETSSILNQGQFSYLTQDEQEKKKVFHFGILANIKTGNPS